MVEILEARKAQIHEKGTEPFAMACEKQSLAGAVSQRACVFCGSRVVLYPIADAVHLVHGPIGCAVYTWDIRGALTSGPELHRMSFSHRPPRKGRHLRRREEALCGPGRIDRPLPAQRGVRLFDVHRRPDRRRRGRGLPPRRGREGHSRAADPLRRLSRHARRTATGRRATGWPGSSAPAPRTASAAAASTSSAISTSPARRG